LVSPHSFYTKASTKIYTDKCPPTHAWSTEGMSRYMGSDERNPGGTGYPEPSEVESPSPLALRDIADSLSSAESEAF
jgi:hypothetical protein